MDAVLVQRQIAGTVLHSQYFQQIRHFFRQTGGNMVFDTVVNTPFQKILVGDQTFHGEEGAANANHRVLL